MSKLRLIVICFLLFVWGAILAFYLETHFCRLIRYLYSTLTYDRIRFLPQKFEMFFPDLTFMFSFGAYLVILFFLLIRQTIKQRALNVFLSLTLLSLSIVVYCYFDGHKMLIECTGCDGGFLYLRHPGLDFSRVLIFGLIISLLPHFGTVIRNRRTRKMKSIFSGSFSNEM